MVTILLPVHNDEKYINFTLESLLSQTYKEYKCIIGFNGTIDKSREIVESCVGRDKRFIIKDFGDSKGKSLTLNKLLDIVESDYICLIDGDDMWNEKKLESQIKVRESADIIGTLASYINENNQKFHNLTLSQSDFDIKRGFVNGHNQIVNSSCLLKTSDAKEINGWDQSVDGLEDFDFWLKLFKLGKTFFNIQDYLVYHRIHPNSNFNSKKLRYTVSDILNKNKIDAYTII
jgi:glycosyltransferase involved in cell wall biosynthesis